MTIYAIIEVLLNLYHDLTRYNFQSEKAMISSLKMIEAYF
jgi:hypothetical protein